MTSFLSSTPVEQNETRFLGFLVASNSVFVAAVKVKSYSAI
jgi:hypothetical protein